jgi:hypothetical protein
MSLMVSSFVICQSAKPAPLTHTYVDERAVRPFASVTSATARSVPAFVGRYATLAVASGPVCVRSVATSTSRASL